MSEPHEAKALLLTDLVDSAGLATRLGDEALAALSAAHDRVARDLLRQWQGREIDKTDGFLLLFDRADQALGYALAYHRALAALTVPLQARAGLHVGAVLLRETPAEDVARGAKPVEVDGISKPLAARVMSTARGGQTLLTRAAVAALAALGPIVQRLQSHGHWRVQGLAEPIELFEVGDEGAPFMPPPDAPKVFRVVSHGDLWLPVREIRNTLPAERDAFVGRRAMLRELAARFESGARLVSLLGIGGCGKTRLATRFGWLELGHFPGGVWFCDLAPARDPGGLAQAVAEGLGLPLGREEPVAQIGNAIAGRGECLVILDNFEQVARHAESTLGRWAERAAQARFLVTTREVLGIAGEEAVALAPLQQADAEDLFMRRAQAARRDFQPAGEELAAIGPLVRLLDGLPLAIELAAARVRALPPRMLLARMSERFRLLASSGNRLDRQSTLRAAFDWSWDLLSPAEKSALAQLSVFEGGFTLEAAEATIDLAQLDEPPWTVDVVNSLVDKSFVRVQAGERFDLLMSVQAYAAEHLRTEGRFDGSGATALASAQGRHADWFADIGAERSAAEGGVELGNLIAACRRSTAAERIAAAVGALEGAWAALALRGPFRAGAEIAEAVCRLPGLAGEDAARAFLAWGQALEALGQRADAMARFESGLGMLPSERAAAGPLPPTQALRLRLRVQLATVAARVGQADRARADHLATLEMARAAGEAGIACMALNGLGHIDLDQGRMDAARQHYEAALVLAQQTGNRRLQGSLHGNLGNVDASVGRMDAARRHHEAALAIARELGDRQREGNTLSNIGMLLWTAGELEAAGASCEGALVVARELGHAQLECIVLCNLGLVRDAMGLAAAAQSHFEEALAVARRIGNRQTEGQVLGYLGLTQARQGRFELARASFDGGEALLRQLGDRLSLGVLGCNRAEAEWLAGQAQPALATWRVARALADEIGAGADSELGVALARLQRLFAAPPE